MIAEWHRFVGPPERCSVAFTVDRPFCFVNEEPPERLRTFHGILATQRESDGAAVPEGRRSEDLPQGPDELGALVVAGGFRPLLLERDPASGVDERTLGGRCRQGDLLPNFPSKDDLVIAWLRGPDARWLDWVVAELETWFGTPLQRLVGFWGVLDEWTGHRGFPGMPLPEHLDRCPRSAEPPIHREVGSYIGEVDAYLARTARAAGVPDPDESGKRL